MADAPAPGADSARNFPQPSGLEILSRIGVGRRSQWFKAEQVRLGRPVALKYLRPSLAESEEFREVFLEAGRQAAAIVHHAALPIFNVFPAQNAISMQWCPFPPLKNFTHALPPLRVAGIGETVLDCLSSLHATDRCHGNLSPGNIFISTGNDVVLNDFFHPPVMTDGAVTFMSDQRFIAPETIADGVRGWRTDLFSLGCVLHEALAENSGAEELEMLLDNLRAADPMQRAGTPQAVLEAFRRIKSLESSRAGMDGGLRRRRMYRRVPAEFTVSLTRRSATPDETATILMKTRDIGESGVFIETDDELLVVGSILELDFTLKGVEGNVHAFGIVRWQSRSPMPQGVGIQFVEVDLEGLANLREYLGRRSGHTRQL